MSEQRDGVQAYYFGRWLAGYVRTSSEYRNCNAHIGQGIISCLPENVSNESQPAANSDELANPISADGLVTNEDGEIVFLVKFETGGLGLSQLREYIRTISSCNRYTVRRPNIGQYFFPTPKTRYIIAGAQSGPSEAAKVSLVNEFLVELVLEKDPSYDKLKNITIVTAKNGHVLGKLKRVIVKLMPRYSNPRDINSFQAFAQPMV